MPIDVAVGDVCMLVCWSLFTLSVAVGDGHGMGRGVGARGCSLATALRRLALGQPAQV